MKITGVEVACWRGPHHEPACIVHLATDEPLAGVAVARAGIEQQLDRAVAELLLGEDPRAVAGLWQRMQNARTASGAALSAAAVAALDVALWDLKAKANDEPLWKTLGGSRPKANAHISLFMPAGDDSAWRERCERLIRQFGFRGTKLPVGLDQQAELRQLELIHCVLQQWTSEPSLYIDAGQRWSPKDAIRRVREMEERFDLAWVEQPVRREDFLGLKRVSAGIRAAVCAGADPRQLLPHLHHHALDVVQIDVAICGVSGALQLADAAFGFELPVTLSSAPGNMHTQLAAAMPYCAGIEVIDPVAENAPFSTDVRIEDGWAIAGDRAGNGLLVNRDALRLSGEAAS